MIFVLLTFLPYASVIPWAIASSAGRLEPIPAPALGASHFRTAQDMDGESDGESEPESPSALGPAPKGAAPDTASRSPSPPLSAAEAAKRSREWEAKRLGSGDWRVLLSDRWAVRSDTPVEEIRTVAAWAEALLDAVHGELKGNLAETRLSIRLFENAEEFRIYATCRGVPDAQSFYDAPQGEMVLCRPKGRPLARLTGVLARHLVHQYLDRVMERWGPPWVIEGLAEHFADYTVADGRIAFGTGPDRPRLLEALEKGRFAAMADLASAEECRGALRLAQAASLIRFLRTREPRAAWELARGKPLSTFGVPADLEKAWVDWIKAEPAKEATR